MDYTQSQVRLSDTDDRNDIFPMKGPQYRIADMKPVSIQ